MKQFMKRVVLFAALYVATMAACYAQGVSQVEAKVNEIVKKYEKTQGVECMNVVKGSGLGMLKTMLRGQFGKEFMRGVTGITIIDYSDASQEVCLALREELEVFTSMLEELKAGDEKKSDGNDYVRSFASLSEGDKSMSDFVIAVEDKDTKMIMYMAGKIKVED